MNTYKKRRGSLATIYLTLPLLVEGWCELDWALIARKLIARKLIAGD